MVQSSPFVITGSLPENTQVYIEREADRKAAQNLNPQLMNYVALIDPHQQGKTSLIWHLRRKLSYGRKYYWVYLDLSVRTKLMERERWSAPLEDQILKQIQEKYPNFLQMPDPPRSNLDWFDFLTALAKRAEDTNFNLIMVLDEATAVPEACAFDFFQPMRAIHNHRMDQLFFKRLSFIIACAYDPALLMQDSPVSNALTVFQYIDISDFKLNEVQKLVGFLPNLTTENRKIIAERLYYWVNGHPFLTQWLCNELFESKYVPSLTSVDETIESFLQSNHPHWQNLKKKLDDHPNLHPVLKDILRGKNIPFVPGVDGKIKALKLMGLVKANSRNDCKIRNHLYEQLLRKLLEQSSKSSQPDRPSQKLGRPIIKKTRHIDLAEEEKKVLRAMFSASDEIAVDTEFDRGFSGSRVVRVRPSARLPVVAKIAPVHLIKQEQWAYQTWVENTLHRIARLESVTLPPNSRWGGLSYTLIGGGVYAVQSLADYYRQTDIGELRQLLNDQLFQIMGQQWWLDSWPKHNFQMLTDYDTVLPVNLLIKPNNTSFENDHYLIDPDQLPLSLRISAGDSVHLKNFVITDLDLETQQLTLNLASTSEDQLPISCRLRLVDIPNIDRYQVYAKVDSFYGVVEANRHDLLKNEVNRMMEGRLDLKTDLLNLSDDLTLPNPLLAYHDILDDFRTVKFSTIHGDLNLQNILVNSDNGQISLIDFATARKGHSLHDLLRLETEVLTRLLPNVLVKAKLPLETIHLFYRQLHSMAVHPGSSTAPKLPHVGLEKPFAVLIAIRNMARTCLFNPADWTEYYQGLILYLLGALKFESLDNVPEAPLPKRVAFWGAATLVDLLNSSPKD